MYGRLFSSISGLYSEWQTVHPSQQQKVSPNNARYLLVRLYFPCFRVSILLLMKNVISYPITIKTCFAGHYIFAQNRCGSFDSAFMPGFLVQVIVTGQVTRSELKALISQFPISNRILGTFGMQIKDSQAFSSLLTI